MQKLAKDVITKTDIAEYLASQDDFALELRTLNVCNNLGYDASHGGTYTDPVTGKTRQYDIRASTITDSFKIQLAIECKSLQPNFPFVVSCVPRSVDESFHDFVYSCTQQLGGRIQWSTAESSAKSLRLRESGIYKVGNFVGKCTAQIGRSLSGELISGDSEVFDKWSQAIASAYDLIVSSGRDFSTHRRNIVITVTLPVLVIPDGTLWTVSYGADGAQVGEPKQEDECTIYIGKEYEVAMPRYSYTLSHLHVFTFSKFRGYLNRLRVNDNYTEMLFPDDVLKRMIGCDMWS